MSEPVRTRYEWSSTYPSTAVVESVAAAIGRDPAAIGPLYESVDPDALDALVLSDGVADAGAVVVSVTLAGCRVTVRGSGEVVVHTADRDD
jgi:hypothetical protein